MTESRYTLELHYQIWNDHTGERIEIGPDRDGLDLIEIRQRNSDGSVTASILLDNKQADLLLQALVKFRQEGKF